MAKKNTKKRNKKAKNNNSKFGLIVSIFLIIIVISLITIIFSSYALWTQTYTQTTPNLVATGCFEINFSDVDENDETTNISLSNTYPISDTLGKNLKPYTFTIVNTCSVPAKYKISLSTLSNSTLQDKFINYTFNLTSASITPKTLLNSTQINLDKETLTIINNANNPNSVSTSYLLEEGTLAVGEDKEYNLRLWMNLDATNNEMETNYSAVVSVSSVSGT